MHRRSFTTPAPPEKPGGKPALIIDNHGHVGALKPEDLVEGYNPQLDRTIFQVTESKLGLSPHQLIEVMDAHGVDMAVLHTLRVWANKYQARVLREFPNRFISVCKLDEQKAYKSEQIDKLHRYVGDWGFRGLYYDPPPGSDGHDSLATSKYDPLWKAVDSLKITVSFVTYTGSPSIGYGSNFESLWPILLRLLEKFPDLPVVIVHGIPPQPCLQPDNSVQLPEKAIRLVKEHNVILGILAGHLNYGPNDEVLKSLYDNFGPGETGLGLGIRQAGPEQSNRVLPAVPLPAEQLPLYVPGGPEPHPRRERPATLPPGAEGCRTSVPAASMTVRKSSPDAQHLSFLFPP